MGPLLAAVGPLLACCWPASKTSCTLGCIWRQWEARQALAATPLPARWRSWERIQASGELRRMSRTHIHFASQPKHLRGNDWASVLLQVGPAQHAACMHVGVHVCVRAGRCCRTLCAIAALPFDWLKGE